MDSLRGQLLLAPPHLTDPNFSKSVVLMVQHDEDGALGLVLNRPTEKSLRELWQHLRGRPCQRDGPVFMGGPVAGPLMALHADLEYPDLEVVDGVYCCTSAEKLDLMVDRIAPQMRFFAGYSGWGERQLEMELQLGSWLTAPARAEHIFQTHVDDLWQAVFRTIADDTSLPDGFAPDSSNPSLN